MKFNSGPLICGTKFTGQNGTISSQPLNNSSIDLTDLITNNYNLLSSSIFQSSTSTLADAEERFRKVS